MSGTVEKGENLLRASWTGTALLFVTSLLAVLFDSARLVAVIADVLLFLGGAVAFFWAYAVAVGRSREVDIGIGGLFFLAGETAPKEVRRPFMASLAAEVVIAVAAAAVRPFTPLAFGILVPMWGLALAGLWGARYGTFRPRAPREPRQPREARRRPDAEPTDG